MNGDDGWHTPETFRIFPYFETVESYREILERNGLRIVDEGEVPGDPARQIGDIHKRFRDSRDAITNSSVRRPTTTPGEGSTSGREPPVGG